MKCEFCDQDASVFLTQLVEGNVKHVLLCSDCAKEHGVTDPSGFSLADLLFGGPATAAATSSASSSKSAANPAPAGNGKACQSCGFSLDDLQRVRRMGCPDCYTAFAQEVAQIIRTMHSGPSHQGKVPAGLMARQVLHQRLEELRSQLTEAISAEHYEEAAAIRDQIRRLSEDAP